MPKNQLTLSQKILRISKAADVVARSGTAEDGSAIATIGDVLDTVKSLMDRYGLTLIPGEECSIHGDRIVLMHWKLGAPEMGYEVFAVPGCGEGEHAIAKAVTSSRKSALICAFNLRIADEPEAPTTEESKELAQVLGDKKAEQARKRAATKEAKEFVTVSWPDSHNRHFAMFKGRLCVMEHRALGYMENVGKWNEMQQCWFVPSKFVEETITKLVNNGCMVHEAQS